MKPIYAIAAIPLFTLAAAAQDAPLAHQVKILDLQGAVMSKTVKGAPYSGIEVTETNQVLADGTRIHNETQTQVWRDSEGRVRRETGGSVTIFDPVANTTFALNPKTQTGRKLPLGTYAFSSSSNANGTKTEVQYFRFSSNPDHVDAEKKLADSKATYAPNNAEMKKAVLDAYMAAYAKKVVQPAAATESLGKRMMEGLNADGTRETSTIEAGSIGNDRPIQVVTERWYSPELQTILQSRHADPRTGEDTFKLTNVNRAEPPAYLFQVPAGYQIQQ